MSTYKAEIDVMPLPEILDPQGKAVKLGLGNLGLAQVQEVRVGKHITLTVEAADKASAEKMIDEACKKLLANLIVEGYTFTITEV